MTEQRAAALHCAAQQMDSGSFRTDLARRVAIPTESQDPDQRPELYRYLTEEMEPALKAMGFDCETFENPLPQGGPFLVGERQEDENRPTLVSYGHCDVVRGLPEQWRDGLDPWVLTLDGDRWYGRGTADNKSQHSIILAALKCVLETRGRLGFNVKIVLETSEEVGSPGLNEFCRTHADRLAGDVFVASDGPRLSPDRACLKLGNRGAVPFDLKVNLREGSRHSGHWGGVLDDPGVLLAHAITKIVDQNGRILVDGWLPSEIPPRVREMIRTCEVDTGDAAGEIRSDWGEPGLTMEEKIFGWTSFIVLSMLCGRPENPINGVQPNAIARCQIRYSVDVDPDQFLPALRRHLDAHDLGMVEIVPIGGSTFKAWRTDPENPWVSWAASSIAKTVGYEPSVLPNMSGGVPSEYFGLALNVPVLWVPHSYPGCCQHGPNEHILASTTRESLQVMTGLFFDLGDADLSTFQSADSR